MNRFDVVVVGGGPAGCAAAISCAQRGLSVALLERQRFPRFRPGESLHPGIEPLLEQLGVAAPLQAQDVLRFTGQWVQWDGPPHFNAFGGDSEPWQGFQMNRARLDAALIEQASALGVTVLQPCRAQRVLTDNGQLTGVETDSGPLFCRCLIDASGAAAWLSQRYPVPMRRWSPLLVARYGYLKGCLPRYAQAPGLQADPHGWTWVARVQDQLLHWTRLYFTEGKSAPRTVPEQLRTLHCAGPVRGADVSWRISCAPAGAGYFIVGDAASLLDPAASHGVLKALMTGMQAAQAVFDGHQRPALRYSIQVQYSQWLHEWFKRDVAQMRGFYRTHPCPPAWC